MSLSALDIVIADDHPIVRVGVKAFLAEQPIRFRLVGEASSGGELLDVLHSTEHVDVVITDFAMDDGGQDGLRLLRRLRQLYPSIRIVVLTMLTNAALIRSVQALGVRCIVGKRGLHEHLALAIEAAIKDRPFLSPELATLLEETSEAQINSDCEDAQSVLSPRQIETLRFLRSGMKVSEIAAVLNRSKKTISAQKKAAMAKLGLTNDAQLYEYLQNNFER